MESTETRTRVAYGQQQGQLIAGRYRLGALHHGDESNEVWRARDEETAKAVTLEFHRDPDPASKERFLAGARRLASAEQPSVMRVAAIHDDPVAAFIVFEHLVDIPVAAEWVQPGTVQAVPAVAVEKGPTPPALEMSSVAVAVADERPSDRGLSLLLFAIRTRELALIDAPLLEDSATEFVALVRSELASVRLDPSVISDFRAFVSNADLSVLLSAPARAAGAIGHLFTRRPRARLAVANAPYPSHVRKIRITPEASARSAKPRAPRSPSRLVGRVRFGRVLTRGVLGGVLVTVLLTMPPDVAVKLASEAASTVGGVAAEVIATIGTAANDVSATIREKLAAVQPAPTLARASFELPPLSAYGAAFEAQAPYPNANPNATVEWVVALRNTGSVGWYRGIDGAQASLALADGTSAGVQTTDFVGPGQVGWFVVHFAAPSQVGVAKVQLLPRIDGRGSLPDLGIYATVTVSPNP